MKLHWYTLMFNESEIIPYVVDYWKKIINDGINLKVIVYDNHSTDNSVELLSKYDWIEIRYFDSDGTLNDVIHQYIKNNCWRESKGKCDFVICSDFDEIYWSNNFASELQYMKDNNFNVLGCKWYAFCGDEKPKYEKGKYLHQLVKKGYEQNINHMQGFSHLGKFNLFDPNKILEMNWSVGNHLCNPLPELRLYVSDKIISFHINKGLGEDFFASRRLNIGRRLSDTNKKYGMGFEYQYPEEKIREEYKNNQNKSIDISNL